ncbi:MAG: type II toxin-antitoxin system VapC family toxin [Acidimicrobiales bacterium]
MILVDTSAWVEYDRATGSAADQRLAALIANDGPLMVTEPILMEVMAGARSDGREADLRRLMVSFGLVPFDAVTDFEAAARIYRRCRQAGVTPRGMVDCMIAAVAYRCGAALLSWDIDMDRVAQVIGVELDEASLRA